MFEELIIPISETKISETQDMNRIQAIIDQCFLSGGGTVILGDGTFYTGGIRIRSHVTLVLSKGTRLVASRNPQDYFIAETDEVEPLEKGEISDIRWIPMEDRTPEDRYSWINVIGTTWNHAIIRAIRAEDITIIGEPGSVIDGSDCYDVRGEEDYRGPHGINFHDCKNIKLKGYTIENTGNWAHCICDSSNITISDITVNGGHDGVDLMACEQALISDCEFHTGDDCVAGYGSKDIEVRNCIINTACSGFRIGGNDIRIHDCRFYGPAKYLFRGQLSLEEKISGKPNLNSNEGNHRYNMLSAVTYFAADGIDVKEEPGNIVVKDCTFDNIERFVHYNFSGNEPWQMIYPLHDITFENIKATGIQLPLTLYGDSEKKVTATFRNVQLKLSEDYAADALIHAAYVEALILSNVSISNAPENLIKYWNRFGKLITDGLSADRKMIVLQKAENTFTCDWI